MAKFNLKDDDLVFYAEIGSDYFAIFETEDNDFWEVIVSNKNYEEKRFLYKRETKNNLIMGYLFYYFEHYTSENFKIAKIKVDKLGIADDYYDVMTAYIKYFESWADQSDFSIKRDAIDYVPTIMALSFSTRSIDKERIIDYLLEEAYKKKLPIDLYKVIEDFESRKLGFDVPLF